MAAVNAKPMLGLRFGSLVVKSFSHHGANHQAYWKTLCDCGKEKTAKGSHLRSGGIRSCGCAYSQPKSHGKSGTRTYNIWCKMIARCTKKSDLSYPNYGGRGISVCAEWLAFEKFYADMGECPKGLSIDRINNNLGYFKGNCRWATSKQQAANRRERKDSRRLKNLKQ